MKTNAMSNNPKETFKNNLRILCDIYKENKENEAKSYAAVYSKIGEYCVDNDLECFSDISFKKWLSGAAIPDSKNILLLCDFFGCDANFLFDIESINPADEPIQFMSKADKYIYENYGLDKKTLEFFKRYKDKGIDSVDDRDKPHLAASKEQSFSSLFNELIHKSPWTINALLQVLFGEQLNLSDHGFAEIENAIKAYPKYPGISRHLIYGFDIDVALSLLAIRLKWLYQNPDYIPSETNLIETYDAELLTPSAVDDYISNLLSTRLRNLNSEIEELTTMITD